MVSTSLLLCGIDLTVLHVAVPRMSLELHPSSTGLLWIVDIYSLTLAALLVTCGTLGDRIGRKRLVLGGFALFGLASAAAGLSTTTAQLLASRVALGVGAAMIMASTVAIIRVVFTDSRERAIAIGVWTSAHSVGATLGPSSAAWSPSAGAGAPPSSSTCRSRWSSSSWAPASSPSRRTRSPGLGPDQRRAVHRRARGVVYALKKTGEHMSLDAPTVATALGGLLLLGLFVRRQRRLDEPLLDFSLFSDRRFSTATLCVIGCFGSYVALLFFLTQWLQQVGSTRRCAPDSP
ncbi:MFS transporter [Streptomyces sp. M19]